MPRLVLSLVLLTAPFLLSGCESDPVPSTGTAVVTPHNPQHVRQRHAI